MYIHTYIYIYILYIYIYIYVYIKELPVNKRNDLLSEIENLEKHVEKGWVSRIPPGGGTENSGRLHRYLNWNFLRGANCLSVEVAKLIAALYNNVV